MTSLSIPDMSCGHCKATVEKTLLALDPAAQIAFDMEARKIDLTTKAAPDRVLAALSNAGYPAR